MAEINKLAIVGAGVMGHGIAAVAAISGQSVNITDIKREFLEHAKGQISTSVAKLSEKGTIKEKPEEIVRRIQFTTDLSQAVRDVDLVIEAVSENLQLKSKILGDIEKYASPRAIIATNTSGLSINMLSEATRRPDRFIGMHWFNPPVLNPMVEIVKSDRTSDAVVHAIIDACKRYKKITVVAKKDVWFFLVVRAQAGWHLEGALMVNAGRASVQEIDAMVRYKLGLAMGPFETADLTGAAELRYTGLESTKKILKTSPSFEPWPALLAAFELVVDKFYKPMTEKGLVGIKSGKGFYTYPGPGKYRKVDLPREASDKVNPIEMLAVAANTSAWCVTNGVGTIDEVDLSYRQAYNWPKGIFQFVKEYGVRNIIEQLENKQKSAPESIKGLYEPDPLLAKLT